jgi:hypothetical protein
MLVTIIVLSFFALLIGYLIKISKKNLFAVVDYDLPLPKAIAAGKFVTVNKVISAVSFPAQGRGRAKVKFIIKHFDKRISTENVLKELNEQGLRAATIEELLAFGVKYPHASRVYNCIIALGTFGRDSAGHRVMACIRWYSFDYRVLDALTDFYDWNHEDLLVVRK